MYISLESEKAFDKLKHYFIINVLEKVRENGHTSV